MGLGPNVEIKNEGIVTHDAQTGTTRITGKVRITSKAGEIRSDDKNAWVEIDAKGNLRFSKSLWITTSRKGR